MKKMTAFLLAICILFTCAVTVSSEPAADGLSFVSMMPIYRDGTWIKRKYVAAPQSNLIADGGFESGGGSWDVPSFTSGVAVSSEPAAVHTGEHGLILSPQSGTAYNLISNPGFENGLDGWNASSTFSGVVSSEASSGGGHSLKIENLPRYASVSCTAQIRCNTDYVLQFRYLGNARYSTCVVRNSSGGMITSLAWQTGNEGCTEWTLCSVPFSSDESGQITVEIFASAKGIGTYYLDDFLLTDGMGNESYAASFPVTVEPDTEYLVGMWLRSAPYDPSRDGSRFCWGVAESSSGEPVYSGVAPVDDGAWHLCGYFFRTGSSPTVYLTLAGAGMTVCADDIFLCKSSDKIEYTAPGELLEDARVTGEPARQTPYNASGNLFDNYDFSASDPDGGFWSDENGSLWGNQVTVSDSGTPAQGNALHYRAAPDAEGNARMTGAYYMRELAVIPGTEYLFSVKYRIVSPSVNTVGDSTNFALLAANRKEPLVIKKYDLNSAAYHGGAWQTASFTFTTGGYNKVAFALLDAGGEAYFDDFILIPAGSAVGENLLDNGSFERNVEDWYVEPTGRIFPTDDPHDGEKSYYIQPDQPYQLILKRVTVQKNTDYLFTFWYRGTPGWAQYYVRDTSEENPAIAKAVFLGNGDEITEWTQVSVPFNSGNYTEYRVGVMTSGSSYPFRLDDVSVAQVCEYDDSDTGLLRNGDFETPNAAGWSDSAGQFCTDRTNVYSGKSCIKAMPGAGAEIGQSAAVEPDTDYILSFYCRGAAASAELALTDGSGNELIPVTQLSASSVSDWKNCTIRFHTGSVPTVNVAFCQRSASAVWYLDDVKLIRADNRISGTEDESGAVRVFAQRVQPGTPVPVCFSAAPGFKPIGLTAVPENKYLPNGREIYPVDLTADAAAGIVTMPGFNAVMQGVFTELADVNADRTVNIADLVRLKRICADAQFPDDGYSDQNGDGSTDSADLIPIRNRLLQ